MKRTSFFLFFLLLIFSNSFAQNEPVAGDYKTIASGEWWDFTVWEKYNGFSWSPIGEDDFPSNSSSVYLQESHNILLDSSALCANLHIHEEAFLNLDTATLEVHGKLRFFENSSPNDELILPTAAPGKWIRSEADGKLLFRGNADRTIVGSGVGGTTNGLAGWNMEIYFDDGAVATVAEEFRTGNLTVSAGQLSVDANSLYVGESSTLSGNIWIKDNATLIAPETGIYRTFSDRIARFVIDSLAEMVISSSNLIIAADSLGLLGKVTFDEEASGASLYFPSNNDITDAAAIEEFNHIHIGGTSDKLLTGDIVVNGTFTYQTDAYFEANGYDMHYGPEGTLEYSGANGNITTDNEFPAVNGPSNLIINIPSLSLHDHRVLQGKLTLNGALLYLGDYNLVFGPNSPLIGGTFSETSMVVISPSESGELKKVFDEPGAFYFPIGVDAFEKKYTPAALTVNPEGFSADTLGLSVTEEKYSRDISAVGFINRYWSISNTTAPINIDGSFLYHEDDAASEESSMNVYHYYDDTLEVLGAANYNSKLLTFKNVDVTTLSYISGSNWGNVTNNSIDADLSVYCGSVDLPELEGSSLLVGGLEVDADFIWEMRFDQEEWTTVVGENGKDYDPELLTESGFYEFRRKALPEDDSIYHLSNILSVFLYPAVQNTAITAPGTVEYCVNGTGFNISGETATGGDGTFSYQWQRRKNEEAFADIGDDEENYTETEVLTPGRYEYRRATISATCDLIYSDTVVVEVYSSIGSHSVSADTYEFCGLPEEIEVKGSDPVGGSGDYNYMWERRVGAGSFEVVGGNTKNLVDDDITEIARYEYRRTVYSLPCNERVSANILSIHVYPELSDNTVALSESGDYCAEAIGFSVEGSDMSGGDGDYIYLWERSDNGGEDYFDVGTEKDYLEEGNPGSEPLAPGTYMYRRTVWSSVCSVVSEPVTVNVQEPVTNNYLEHPSEENSLFCGSTDGFLITGSTPLGGSDDYTYRYERRLNEEDWITVGEGDIDFSESALDVPGTYQYRRIVSTALCNENVSDTVTVLITAPIQITATVTETIDNNNSGSIELEVTGGTPPYSYTWTNAANTQDIENLDGDDYGVLVIDANNCQASETFTVPRVLGLSESPNVQSYKLYPNPVVGTLHVEVNFLKAIKTDIVVINSLGKVIKTIKPEVSSKLDLDVDMSAYPEGIYFVKVVADGKVETWRFVKK